LEAEKKNLEARAEAVGKVEGPEAKAQVLQEGKALLIAKKRTEEAQIELRQKQRVVEAAAREASLKLESIGLDEELINAQMDFLSDVGGSFSSILKLQQAGVQLERERLRVLEEELQASKEAGIEGLELRKKEQAVEIQRLKLRQKEFGVQKDIFEKLIGKAFGELQTDIGAARRRASDVGLLGRERTRVEGRSGLFLRAGQGDLRTIDERTADRILGGLQGLGGALPGRGGGGGVAEGPKRLKIEEQIAQYNATTADTNKKMYKEMTTPGSIYTHDMATEGWLRIIAQNTGNLSDSFESADWGGEDLTEAQKKAFDKLEAQVKADMEAQNKSKQLTEEQKKTFEQFRAKTLKEMGGREGTQEDLVRALTGDAQAQEKVPQLAKEQLAVAKVNFKQQTMMARQLMKTDPEASDNAFAVPRYQVLLLRE
jgi:hypothetical protein